MLSLPDVVSCISEIATSRSRKTSGTRDDDSSSAMEQKKNSLIGIGTSIPVDGVPPEVEVRKYRKVTRYTSLKNIATSFEYFLKSIAKSQFKNFPDSTLRPIIEKLMVKEEWYKDYEVLIKKGVARSSTIQEYREIEKPSNINEFWARNFAFTLGARNYSVHNYSTDDWIYDEYMGIMLDAILYSLFYSWSMAKRKGWVKTDPKSA